MRFNIGHKLISGFSVVIGIFAIAVGATLWQISNVNDITSRIVQLRMPTAAASAAMTNDINSSLAALRGYMLTGKASFKDDRAEIWLNIDLQKEKMNKLSKNWTNPDNIRKLKQYLVILEEFRIAQNKIETISHSPEGLPATRMMLTQAAPRATELIENITKIIDLEVAGQGGVNGDRIQLFSVMANIRRTLAMSMTDIRAYLQTGEEKTFLKFDQTWARNKKQYSNLMGQLDNLSTPQRAIMTKFSKQYEEFEPLPDQIFTIRRSEKWNVANYILLTEAAPKAQKLLDILMGEQGVGNIRAGGMVENQQNLLGKDASSSDKTIQSLGLLLWLLLGASLIVGIFVVTILVRAIAHPISNMTDCMMALAEGNNSIDIEGTDKTDEIGNMARAVLVFKENAQHIAVMENTARAVIQSITVITNQVQKAVNDQAITSSEQAGSVAETSTSLEEIRETAGHTRERAKDLSRVAKQSLSEGEAGTTEMIESVVAVEAIREKVGIIAENMMTLSEQNRKVGEITTAVNNLAQQSKMLAVNASIEAAKAGEAGKGFAVVAEEMGNLALQSEEATVQVRGVLDQIGAATEKAVLATEEGTKQVDLGTTLIQSAGERIKNLNRVIGDTTTETSRIVESINQQSGGISQVALAMREINKATSQFATTSKQIQNAMEKLTEEVDCLVRARR